MKTLYLVRHAKSSWEHLVDDFDRPLIERGILDAHNISMFLKNKEIQPQMLYSSPAARALQTAVIFARNLDVSYKNLSLEPVLYHIGAKDLLSWLRKRPENQDVIMVFGHNPGITDFVNKCIDHHIDNVPTTGVAHLEFDVDLWSQIDKKADLRAFDYPKNQKKKL